LRAESRAPPKQEVRTAFDGNEALRARRHPNPDHRPRGQAGQGVDAAVGRGADQATAVLAMIGNGYEFKCGRQFAAWLRLTPGQYSSGGKTRLGRITKAGDAYLRTLLIVAHARCSRQRRTRPMA
jgi:transposase